MDIQPPPGATRARTVCIYGYGMDILIEKNKIFIEKYRKIFIKRIKSECGLIYGY